jgi:hypothetical protein
MAIGSLSPADKAKLQNMIKEGVQVMQDVAALKLGLRETVDAIAEELDIQKSVLNKAIRFAYKMSENSESLNENKEQLEDIEDILLSAGAIKA